MFQITFACLAMPAASRTQDTMSRHASGELLSACRRHMLWRLRVPVHRWTHNGSDWIVLSRPLSRIFTGRGSIEAMRYFGTHRLDVSRQLLRAYFPAQSPFRLTEAVLRHIVRPRHHQRLRMAFQRDHMPHPLILIGLQITQPGLLVATGDLETEN